MTLEAIRKQVEEQKIIAEGRLIGALFNDMSLITEYTINHKKMSPVGRFYYKIIDELYKQGNKEMDEVTVLSFLRENKSMLNKYNEYGGYEPLIDMGQKSNELNIDGIVRDFEKYVAIEELDRRGVRIEDIYEDVLSKMPNATQITNWLSVQADDVSLEVSHSDIEYQSFSITDEDLQKIRDGIMIGVRYNSVAPLMDYSTLGFPSGLSIIGSYINMGKTSLSSEIVFSMAGNGSKAGIIANEQNMLDYKQLLLLHVLVHDLKYYKVNRKKFKLGAWDENDEIMIQKARKIIDEKYVPNLSFVEVFDYDVNFTTRVIRRWSKMGFDIVFYDTLKADFTTIDGWIDLINSTRSLFQLGHKEDISIVAVMQVALHTMGRRILDLDILANGKQSSEVASEVIFFRNLHEDEMPGMSNELECHRYKKDAQGRFTEITQIVDINEEYPNARPEDFKVFFISKSRNGRAGASFLMHFNGDYNIWEEVGFAKVVPDKM